MAIVTNTFLTYSAIGNREDLSDVIYNISPTETPFINLAKKSKADARLHEWQTDALAAAAANAIVEGDDTTFAAVTATTRVTNRCQISRKEVIISGTQESVLKAGRKSEIAYQMMKKGKELKRDMEYILLSNQAPVTGNSTTAPLLRGLPSWITTNDSRGASGADGTSSTAATDGTQRDITEAMLKSVLQQVFTSGGDPEVVMCGPVNKQKISAFTGNATAFRDVEDGKLTAAIDVYVSDFGQLKVIPNRFQRERDVFVLSPDMVGVAYLRPFKTEDLAKTGDATKKHIIVEYTLEVNNEAAHGVIADLTTT